MKATGRKRKERRLRILDKKVAKRHAHEAAVASEIRRERRMAHRRHLVNKLDVAIREQHERKLAEPTGKVSFLRRLLGRRA